MIEALLVILKDHILAKNPSTFNQGFAGARQYQDGKIVIYDNFDGTYRGLSDTFANYFYIRYISDPISVDVADERKTSCKEFQVNVPLRLVAWVNNGNVNKLAEILLHDIMDVDFSTLTTVDARRFTGEPLIVAPMDIQLDPEQIYKEETLLEDEDVMLRKRGVLCSVDFGIQFNYRPYEDDATDCLDREICTDVCS